MEFNGPEVVKIKRCAKPGYFGISAYPKSVTVLSCQINSKGGYNTGLTPEEERFYENELNLKPQELNKNSKAFWEKFNDENSIRLFNNKTTEIVLDNPINQIKYKILLAHSDVANSEIEKNKPGVTFYIHDEEARAKVELQTLNFELEGMKLILGLTPEEVKGSLRLFGKNGTDLMSADSAQLQLMQEMKKDPKNFFNVITDKELRTKIFIYELLERKLLTRKANSIKYGDDTIASSINECVEYFNDIKNQTERLTLESKLKKLKK